MWKRLWVSALVLIHGGIACRESAGRAQQLEIAAPATLEEAEKSVTLPFFTRADEAFAIEATYYVAANEKGASNRNNGRYPTYRGGADGPFADLNDARIRALLSSATGVRMVVREGIYRLERLEGSDSGLVLNGAGDELHPVILSGYPGETAVLDAGETLSREQLRRIRAGEKYEIKLQQTVTLEGRFNIVENLTIRNGFRYNVLVLGDYSVIRRNRIEGAFEDGVKTAPGADYGVIEGNDISGFASQGIDSFGSSQWLVKENDIHHPQPDPVSERIEGNGIGGKGGLESYVIVSNTIHDFDTNRRVGAIAFGGGGDLGLFQKDALFRLRPAATRMMAFGNVIHDYRGPAAYFHSCADCSFVGNDVHGALGAVSLGIPPDEQDAETNRGLPNTRNAVVRDNRFAGSHAGLDVCREGGNLTVGTTCYGLFVQSQDALEGLVSEGNVYYSDTTPRFAVRAEKVELLSLDELRARLAIERTSTVRPLSEYGK